MLIDRAGVPAPATPKRGRMKRAMRVEWVGQTAAGLCWIASVLTQGISSPGDWLQLCAASAWLLANAAAIATDQGDYSSRTNTSASSEGLL